MEFVFVVKRADLFDLHYPQGFLEEASHGDEIATYLDRARQRGFFVERRHAEQDSTLKQLIPYTVVAKAERVLLLRRSKKGGDARLHDKLSIGVGGHINPPDAEHGDVLVAAARREIDEELQVDGQLKSRPIGLINDDSNPVGSVHVGAIYLGRLAAGDASVRETETLSARWVDLDELEAIAADGASSLETWSRLIAPRLRGLLAE